MKQVVNKKRGENLFIAGKRFISLTAKKDNREASGEGIITDSRVEKVETSEEIVHVS